MRVFLGLILFLLLNGTQVLAVDNSVKTAEKESEKFIEALSSMPEWIKPPDFRYNPKGKIDPFVPFINKVREQVKRRSKKGPLTPLQTIDVTQLKVIGILWEPENPNKAKAMVELPDGKGFILEKGMVVGRNDGKVVKITPDNIVIEEDVVNIFGDVEKKQVVLKLHPKKGEE